MRAVRHALVHSVALAIALGGMWAVIAAATSLSFSLCLIYLLVTRAWLSAA